MGRPKNAIPSVQVNMKLPIDVVRRLDELADGMAGSRGDVVRALVGMARLDDLHTETVKRGTIRLGDDAE